jgi:hypothetical protein
MKLKNTNNKYFFDPTPSPVPILFISFSNEEYKCNYCKSKYSRTSVKQQLYCESCLFDYIKNLADNNIYLNVKIHAKETQCFEHEPVNKKFHTRYHIIEWCKSCSHILYFNQIINLNFDMDNGEFFTRWDITSPNYLISSEWIESTLVKKPIPIVYFPWWDTSSTCIACNYHVLEYKSDCQKWCPRCFIIYTGCRYCLTTNIIFGVTEQSKCKICKRVIDIDITDIENNLENIITLTKINSSNHNHIVKYMNNIDQKSCHLWSFKYYRLQYLGKANGQIRFIPFSEKKDICHYCKYRYSSTLLFKQKYCKYCLYWYIKELTDKNMCLDVYINTNNNYCVEHKTRNLDFCTQNIQEWCINCSEILYFKQVITKYSFDMNYSYEKEKEISKYEMDYKLQQFSLINTTKLGWKESALAKKSIPIIYLTWWYSNEQCIVCQHILSIIDIFDNQKWCPNCFTIYSGCNFCLTTNIIFGLTNQSQCKICEKMLFITIDTENIGENFLASTKLNTDNHKRIVDYVSKNSNILKIYNFISKLNYFDLKYISYSNLENLENNESLSVPIISIIFVPLDNRNYSCSYCGNVYSVTLFK